MSVPHPIPYQGSKRHLARQILSFFPPGADRLIEPFAGSAAVSLAALQNGLVKQVVIGDSDAALVALWNKIVSAPTELAEAYASLWFQQLGREREYYDFIRAEFNENRQPEHFLYLLVRCVKAAVRYNTAGEFNQSPDNRRKGTRPATMRKNLLAASELLSGRCQIRHGDYQILLDEATPNDVVYLDPPYQGVCNNRDPRYKQKVQFDTFVETLDALNRRRIAYIVSYDGRTGKKNHGELLPDFLNLRRIELAAGRSTQATLLGRNETTFESLYLSPALTPHSDQPVPLRTSMPVQMTLFG